MTPKRSEPPYITDERSMLDGWLEWHRGTLEKKCRGLDDAQLRERSVPPSSLSLLGLVRHMAEVERAWFQRCIGDTKVELLYCTEEDRDGDFDNVDTADVEADMRTWREECDKSRRIFEDVGSLDDTCKRRNGDEISVRWVITHMVEEYARHNGHADLLRERIDGSTGY